MPRLPPPTHPNSAVDELQRRQKIVDLARRGIERVGSVTVSKSYLDQDAWVSGHITLDELVARSQNTRAASALMAQPRSSATTESTPARAVRSDTQDGSAGPEAMTSATDDHMAAADALEVLVVVAASVTEAAVAAAATKTLQAAGAAQAAQAAAATRTALATAETVRQTAHLLQLHADQDADRLASAAEEAAFLVASAVMPGTEAVNAEKATLLAATLRTTAIAKAEETALAAATVARAAATAAASAAVSAADAAMALELLVADTAAAVQAVATETARQVALDTVKAADLILMSGK